jgi:hypothetical protein
VLQHAVHLLGRAKRLQRQTASIVQPQRCPA